MDSLTYIRIQDKDINTYLDTRNLKVNRQYSNTNEKIDKISHYIWWFSDKSRTSYLVKKENKNILILTEDKKFINGKLFINNGFMAFKKKTFKKYWESSIDDGPAFWSKLESYTDEIRQHAGDEIADGFDAEMRTSFGNSKKIKDILSKYHT